MRRFIKFCAVGASGVLVNEGLLWLLTEFAGLFYLVSSAIAIEVSIITNFLLNESWTFRDRSPEHKGLFRRGAKFNTVSLGGLAINMSALFFLANSGVYYLYANLFGIACAVLWNYMVNLKWTWSDSSFGGFRKPETVSSGINDTVSVIIPTFNEEENISKIVPQIFDVFRRNSIKGEVVVVDDNSPDRTWETARELGKSFNVKMVRRMNERGLSSAVVEGFSKASGNIIGVMDADLSHPTNALPRMLEPLQSGDTDLVVGSRHVAGGGIRGWPLRRRVISRGATVLARGLTGVKDPVSGFFFFRREVIDGVKLNPTGYKIGLEVIVKGRHRKVKEVPYVFRDRETGKSKMDTKEILKYLVHLAKLYGYRVKGSQ